MHYRQIVFYKRKEKAKITYFSFYKHLLIMSASEFYYACRNGDLVKVKSLLTGMSPTKIDFMEPNGSTALHAAAYFGHIDIVRLLLDNGASPDQKNKFNKTPEEEAKHPEIAQLLHNFNIQYSTHKINGLITDVFSATTHHRRFYSFSQGPPTLSYVVDKVLNAKDLQGNKIMHWDRIASFFKQAIQSNDATYLIRAYTVESNFYMILNRTLASHNELTNEERENPPWFCAFARFLANDEPTLRPYRWTGVSYRGLKMLKHDVAQYHVGGMLMNKSFMSTSKSRKIAVEFGARSINEYTRSAIIKYIVNDDRAAFDISMLSEYQNEEEVLILPCMDFEIIEINDFDKFIEITLMLH
jgi:hypothetical protein